MAKPLHDFDIEISEFREQVCDHALLCFAKVLFSHTTEQSLLFNTNFVPLKKIPFKRNEKKKKNFSEHLNSFLREMLSRAFQTFVKHL